MSADCKKKEQAAMQGMCGAVLHFYEKENTMEKFLQVGVISSTHGIRGEVKVFPTTDDKERFLDLKEILLDTGKEQIPLEIQNVRFFKQVVILKFKGIDHINDIERYKGRPLFVEREHAVPLEADEYYIADLIGMEVFTEDGAFFGQLQDVIETGANDVYIIDSGNSGLYFTRGSRSQTDDDPSDERSDPIVRKGTSMKFHIMTLFPEMVEQGLRTSIIGRAEQKGLLSIQAVNIRDYAFNKHQSVDDYPYGGGAGMLMQAEPVYQCYKAVCQETKEGLEGKKPRLVYLSPQGRTFNQNIAEEFAQEEELILLCGHYEGIDERVLEEIVTDYVSIGDYVLTGGELAAMVMVDAIARLVPGVLHNDVSAEFESFQDHLLEYPQYSRPEIWHDKQVPPILLSGHHANIEKWRREQSIIRTARNRPDLLEKAELTEKEQKFLEEYRKNNLQS